MIVGFLDGFKGREAYGWASVRGSDRPVVVDILVDGQHVGSATADGYREDLFLLEIRNGYAAFTFTLDERYCDGLDHEVQACVGKDALELAQSPQTFLFLQASAAKRLWCSKNIVLRSPDRAALTESLAETRKLAIFATYHTLATHLPYHHHIIGSLRDGGFTVLVVHATDNAFEVIDGHEDRHAFFLVKRNVGYDFGSYATGFMMLDDLTGSIDELVLINDSIIQIDLDLKPLLRDFRSADADVVACTESFERRYHLQSYCLWMNRAALTSAALDRFMTGYSFTSVKDQVIEEGEIGFSKALQGAGLRLKALFDYPSVASIWMGEYDNNVAYLTSLPSWQSSKSSPSAAKNLDVLDLVMRNIISGVPTNPSHFFWDVLIDHFRFPFIKRELIIANPCSVPTYAKIASYIAANPRVYAAVYGMIRAFGGQLVPALVTRCPDGPRSEPATASGAIALLPIERPARHAVRQS